MDDAVKAQLVSTAVEVILTKGIPAAIELLSKLNTSNELSVARIRAVRGDLDAADYFKPDEKGVNA